MTALNFINADDLISKIDWSKVGSLVPAIIQDAVHGRVLMLGYMNADSIRKTVETGKATFFSRTRQTLWTKGETSGHFLTVESIALDCDSDTLLLHTRPVGPVCHTGDPTCFGSNIEMAGFLNKLDLIIASRQSANNGQKKSYVASVLAQGLDRAAQKVGEEAVETVIAAKNDDNQAFIGEASDLLFHLMILLRCKGCGLADVIGELDRRHSSRQ